jgi:hypothetical protein
LSEFFEDLALGRKAAFLFLREERLIADADDEDAAAAADEITVEAERLLDGGRQTGSPREVVSNSAVVDSNVHDCFGSLSVLRGRSRSGETPEEALGNKRCRPCRLTESRRGLP